MVRQRLDCVSKQTHPDILRGPEGKKVFTLVDADQVSPGCSTEHQQNPLEWWKKQVNVARRQPEAAQMMLQVAFRTQGWRPLRSGHTDPGAAGKRLRWQLQEWQV